MSRIVMIEDNPNNARLAEKLLKHAGHEVIVRDNGEDGLATILESPPDLVLMDLGLPDVDGQTIVALIRQRPEMKAVTIIAFTAWPEDKARQMAMAYGCQGVISKPIDTRRFAEQVGKFLQSANDDQPTETKPVPDQTADAVNLASSKS
jgi:two-component system, cell cycle response regulator DivK